MFQSAGNVRNVINNLPVPTSKIPSAFKANNSETGSQISVSNLQKVTNADNLHKVINNLPVPTSKIPLAENANNYEAGTQSTTNDIAYNKYDDAYEKVTGKRRRPRTNNSSIKTGGSSINLNKKTIIEQVTVNPIVFATQPTNLVVQTQVTGCSSATKPLSKPKPQPGDRTNINDLVENAVRDLVDDSSVEISNLFNCVGLADLKQHPSKLSYVLLGVSHLTYASVNEWKVKTYNKYCSDHAIILKTINDTIYVSFNVEHNSHVADRIKKFVHGIRFLIGDVSSENHKPKEFEPEKIDEFVSSILHIKNMYILGLLKKTIKENIQSKIIINLQEVSPSMYVMLAFNLPCQITKLTCQHIMEICQDYDKEMLDSMGVFEKKLSETNIQDIEAYIKSLSKKVPQKFDPDKHGGRFAVNGSFVSLVYNPRSPNNKLNSDIDFGINSNNLPNTEEEYAKLVVNSNKLPANQTKFVKSRQIMIHTQICGVESGLLYNGVMLGTFMVNCRGILLEDYGSINYHGHKKYLSSVCLLEGIQSSNLSKIFDIFEHDFNSDRVYKISNNRTYISLDIYDQLLDSFIKTLPVLSYRIKSVAGDFNMSREEFGAYGLDDRADELISQHSSNYNGVVRRTNNNDRILSLDISCVRHIPTVQRKNIIVEKDDDS